jgi:oligoendopeptidase F
MGVSLVDMQVWKWMYEHPTATADELKAQVIIIAKDVWNKYYADVMGSKDEPILAVYSHMIEDPLYLSAYPIGHLVDFQIEKYIEGKPFGAQLQKILLNGSIVPQQWMKNAVGKEVSGQALIDATEEAVKNVKE